jgi:hypothetical protein
VYVVLLDGVVVVVEVVLVVLTTCTVLVVLHPNIMTDKPRVSKERQSFITTRGNSHLAVAKNTFRALHDPSHAQYIKTQNCVCDFF